MAAGLRNKENNPGGSMQRRWPALRGENVAVATEHEQTEVANDRFFGALKGNENENEQKVKSGEGGGGKRASSRLTEEWLDEAKRRVGADTPARHSSPAVLGKTVPRFAAAREAAQLAERREAHSRSARRHRGAERISDEILSRTARHQRNGSDWYLPSPAASTSASSSSGGGGAADTSDSSARLLPPRQPPRRKPRFGDDSPDNAAPRRRSFRSRTSPHRPPSPPLLSPLKNLHRRSISSNTCSSKPSWAEGRRSASSDDFPAIDDDVKRINLFLRRQRAAVGRMSAGEGAGKATIVLSGSSSATSSTSSMVAAICYAWLLENDEGAGDVVVPVVNMKRTGMLKHKQAAWLFHLLGIDASALLFANEVDVEGLLTSRRLNLVVIGQDVLETNGKVGSQCTVLTDNYCENAYDLLHTPNLKKLLLAGILVDTENLNSNSAFSTNKDAEAVQLLLVGSAPRYRHELFEQLMQDHRDDSFVEAIRRSYVKTYNEEIEDNYPQKARSSARKSITVSAHQVDRSNSINEKLACAPASVTAIGKALEPAKTKRDVDVVPASAPAQITALETLTRIKNKKFSLSKLFGIRSK